jgi:hypothetical protein
MNTSNTPRNRPLMLNRPLLKMKHAAAVTMMIAADRKNTARYDGDSAADHGERAFLTMMLRQNELSPVL